MDTSRLIFIGGLHRSGTTALGRVLAAHPSVSGFSDTGSKEDEGQHLQGVYRPAQDFGGPGRFARNDAAHLGPAPAGRRDLDRDRLLEAWTPHWDLQREFLVEKSPPNMIMGRYLQSLFPGSALIVIVRHPVIVALSTKKWRPRTSLERIVDHWFVAHERLRSDVPFLERVHILHYEDLINRTDVSLSLLSGFLGLSSPLDGQLIQGSRSDRYVDMWSEMSAGSTLARLQRQRIKKRFGRAALEYGYDIADVGALGRAWFAGAEPEQ